MGIEQGRTYRLKNVKSGTYLDKSGTDGVSIIGWENNGGENQKWILDKNEQDQWTFRNSQSGQYLAIAQGIGEPDNGTSLVASQEQTGWDIWPDEENQEAYRIFVPGGRHPGINIDLSDHGNESNGTPVTLWGKYRAGVNQTWYFEEA